MALLIPHYSSAAVVLLPLMWGAYVDRSWVQHEVAQAKAVLFGLFGMGPSQYNLTILM
jgi:hypothetical protein